MQTGWSERIREMVEQEYVTPARGHRGKITIQVGELQKKLKRQGFPGSYTNQILTSLESERFWKARGLEMETPLGQPRKHATVLTYRFADAGAGRSSTMREDPLLELAGILQGSIREGADAFIRDLRRDKVTAK